MIETTLWASLSCAASLVDVSPDTILRRAVQYRGKPEDIANHPCPEGKIRRMKLKLGENTRQENRYYVPDLNRWLN